MKYYTSRGSASDKRLEDQYTLTIVQPANAIDFQGQPLSIPMDAGCINVHYEIEFFTPQLSSGGVGETGGKSAAAFCLRLVDKTGGLDPIVNGEACLRVGVPAGVTVFIAPDTVPFSHGGGNEGFGWRVNHSDTQTGARQISKTQINNGDGTYQGMLTNQNLYGSVYLPAMDQDRFLWLTLTPTASTDNLILLDEYITGGIDDTQKFAPSITVVALGGQVEMTQIRGEWRDGFFVLDNFAPAPSRVPADLGYTFGARGQLTKPATPMEVVVEAPELDKDEDSLMNNLLRAFTELLRVNQQPLAHAPVRDALLAPLRVPQTERLRQDEAFLSVPSTSFGCGVMGGE